MKSKKTILYKVMIGIGCSFLLPGCNRPAISDGMTVTILNKKLLQEVPSASGVEVLGDDILMVGDNSPWLFKLNKAYEITDKYQLFSLADLQDGLIPKNRKPDFEAMTLADWGMEKQLLIFGSGSKSPERDSIVIVGIQNRHDDIATYSLGVFYQKVKQAANLKDEELNIEGAVVKDDELYLFNRGENVVMKFDLDAFLRHVIAHHSCPDPQVYHLNLPAVKGVKAGFSGAGVVPGTRRILFTASVENTENWIADGEILGSFVGAIDLDELTDGFTPEYVQLMEGDQTLNIKVESLTVLRGGSGGELDVILVTDSDGGYSELLEIKLK